MALVHDASAFVRCFGMGIACSAPHIYVSALAFTPSSSQIGELYVDVFPPTLLLKRGRLSHWPALEMSIYADSTPRSVAFSPDGQCIASASDDGTIRVWDAATGEVVAGPFTGHTEAVNSVVFSPDGQRLASASDDGTIRLWDAAIGEVAAPSTGVISSLDMRIALASRDRTIRVKKVGTEESEKVYFVDKLLINSDGWMYGEDGELFLWIPQIHRPYFQRSNIVWIVGKDNTELDLSNFVHGLDWTTVHVNGSYD